MEKKPITPFLKVMSIIRIIQSVCGVLVNILGLAMLAALPGLESLVGESSGVEVTPLTWISIIISLVCVIVDVVQRNRRTQHRSRFPENRSFARSALPVHLRRLQAESARRRQIIKYFAV